MKKAGSALRQRPLIVENVPQPSSQALSTVESAFERAAVISALRKLPPRQLEVILLRYYADLTLAEIADILIISKGTVSALTYHAFASLRAA